MLVHRPSPRRLAEAVALADGGTILVRPLAHDDGDALLDGFSRLSEESRYHRFCQVKNRLTPREVRHLVSVDGYDHVALGAADARTGAGVAVARYARDRADPERAELAVVVCDAWQRRGIGLLLTRRLVVRARANGIATFTALHLAGNRRIVGLMRAVGPVTLSPVAAGTRVATMPLLADLPR